MTDYKKLRRSMVDCQLRPNAITDQNVLSAMLSVPREAFVQGGRADLAYRDDTIDEGAGYPLLSPLLVARLIQAANVQPDNVCLNTICDKGYVSAILGKLAGSVVALHPNEAKSTQIGEIFTELDLDNIAILEGNAAEGYPKEGPFDVIVVAAAVTEVPKALLDQLKVGGRLVTILGGQPMGRLTVYGRNENGVHHTDLGDAIAPLHADFAPKLEFSL